MINSGFYNCNCKPSLRNCLSRRNLSQINYVSQCFLEWLLANYLVHKKLIHPKNQGPGRLFCLNGQRQVSRSVPTFDESISWTVLPLLIRLRSVFEEMLPKILSLQKPGFLVSCFLLNLCRWQIQLQSIADLRATMPLHRGNGYFFVCTGDWTPLFSFSFSGPTLYCSCPADLANPVEENPLSACFSVAFSRGFEWVVFRKWESTWTSGSIFSNLITFYTPFLIIL